MKTNDKDMFHIIRLNHLYYSTEQDMSVVTLNYKHTTEINALFQHIHYIGTREKCETWIKLSKLGIETEKNRSMFALKIC